MYEINTPWCLWCHSLKNPNWNKSSYDNLFTINNLLDYEVIKQTLQINHLQNGMFFLMRDGIFPIWEDPDNINGTFISFKLPGNRLREDFLNIILNCICENIFLDKEKFNELNGISLSPKKEFNILKFWFRNKQKKYSTILKQYPPYIVDDKSLIKEMNS